MTLESALTDEELRVAQTVRARAVATEIPLRPDSAHKGSKVWMFYGTNGEKFSVVVTSAEYDLLKEAAVRTGATGISQLLRSV